jgi:cold shock CspA family protein
MIPSRQSLGETERKLRGIATRMAQRGRQAADAARSHEGPYSTRDTSPRASLERAIAAAHIAILREQSGLSDGVPEPLRGKRQRGTVLWISSTRSYGFIYGEDGELLLFDPNRVATHTDVEAGTRVSFDSFRGAATGPTGPHLPSPDRRSH